MNERPLPPKAPEVRELLEPLIRHGVDFVLVGGIAGLAHGSNFPSFDLDVAYACDRANLERLVRSLEKIGVTLRGAPGDLPFQLDVRTLENGANFTFITPYGDFDVLGEIGGISSYEQLRSDAEMQQISGLPVRVTSIDHLIAMKRHSNRTKDRLMVEEYIVLAEEKRRAGERD